MKIKIKDLKVLIENYLHEADEEEREASEEEESGEEESGEEGDESEEEASEDSGEEESEDSGEEASEEDSEEPDVNPDDARKEDLIKKVEALPPDKAFEEFKDDIELLGKGMPDFKIRVPANLTKHFSGKKEVSYQDVMSAEMGGTARAGTSFNLMKMSN